MLIALTLSTRSHAQPVSEAVTLFEEGRAATKRGDFVGARASFLRSYQLSAAVGTLLNLSICEEALGKWTSAQQGYLQVLSQLTPEDPRRPLAQDRSVGLAARMPHVTFKLPAGAPQNSKVFDVVTGNELRTGERLEIDPGDHVWVVRAAGHEDAPFSVSVNEADDKILELTLGAARRQPTRMQQASAPEAERTRAQKAEIAKLDTPPHDSTKTLGWVALGASAGALALSALSVERALNYKKIVEDDCTSAGVCSSVRGLEAANSSATWSDIATGSVIATVVLGITGGWLLLSSPTDHQATVKARAAATVPVNGVPSVALPMVGFGGRFGVNARWEF